MKKILISLYFAVIIAVIANAAVNTQYLGKSPNIIASLIRQEPDPVEPGRDVELSFKLENNGTTANDITLEIIPEYPFSLLPGEGASRFIGTLKTTQNEKQSIIVKYKLKVSHDATDGDRKIKVRYKSSEENLWVILEGYNIKVQEHDAIIGVEKTATFPPIVTPGDTAKLRIELKNYATSPLKDIKVSLDIKGTTDEMPVSPVGSTNEKIIQFMEPQSDVPVEFDLLIDSEASSKAYKIPLSISYSDLLNRNYSKSNILSIVVGDVPDVKASLEKTEVYKTKTAGKIVFRIANSGSSDIKFLNVKILEGSSVKVIGADESYIGKLDSDDFSTVEFKIYADGEGRYRIKIPLQITYTDTNNKHYKDNADVELRLYNSNDAKLYGLESNGNFKWVLVLLIAGIIMYVYYRKRKKSRK